ncbi:MAG: DUF2970 domain-containing protein [Francisellaceae bacterium]|nr:DUF2970 domain-containing protein [Francisellaceae bacterium]MBT6206929.1 DUF2970 domain-containing protein [Francisellaceae bacterium]MBT6538494.1 DUF2970 domain-containing protein [Francisellaceae bacterium]
MTKKTNIWRVIVSVLSAAMGIQSSKNMKQDCENNSPLPYIIVGICFTIIFVGTLLFIVHYVVL